MTLQLVTLVDKITKSITKCDCQQLSEDIKEFSGFVQRLTPSIAQCTLPMLITPYLALHSRKDVYTKLNEELKISFLKVLQDILTKSRVDNLDAFGLLFDFLLMHIFTPKLSNIEAKTNEKQQISEECKHAVLSCISTLFSSLSFELLPDVYTQKQAARLSVLLHTCMELLRREKSRKLRLSAIECIMKCTQVDDTSDLDDVVLLNDIAQLFIKFLPGLASALIVIAVDDQNSGHRIVQQCVKAWGRLVSIVLRDYNPCKEVVKLEDVIIESEKDSEEMCKVEEERKVHDKKLALCANLLKKLAAYDHATVRGQLAESCQLLCGTCFVTLPETIPKVIEILVILSEDNYPEVNVIANQALANVIQQLVKGKDDILGAKILVDNLHEGFHEHVTKIPLIFNGVDTSEQFTAMHLLAGYLKLFATTDTMKAVLFKQSNLDRLMGSLLCVAEIEKSASLLEEYALHDWETTPDVRTPWKTFKCNDKQIQVKITTTCHLLVRPIITDIVLDYLLDVYKNDYDRKAEASLLINEILSVNNPSLWDKTKAVIYTYLEDENWKLNLTVDDKHSLKNVQKNVIQLCLQLEGIGKLALAAGEKFQSLLLKVLYVVLEKAGCSHPMLQAAGLACIANISKACGYNSVTELINQNADYFAYNVTNKLRRSTENASVLSVLAVVMQYSDMDVLPSISDIIEGVLLQSCDRFQERNAFAYLQVFAVFTKSMHKWLKIEVIVDPVITKKQKEEKLEADRRLQWDELSKPVDLSDEIMGKTAEELYTEDMQKHDEEESEELQDGAEEYKKPAPPKHIQLVVQILERSLNFLPAKEANCKILVLEILKSGVEILKDYEDELLPIVHKIWSPLVNRFKEVDTPLIVNRSFSLLSTLGRLSKDFIRMRTVKEVLPSINEVLLKQSKESYLKDRGAAYRYTQGYKMQLTVLGGIARLAYDLELDDKVELLLPSIEVYLSAKQPAPLQEIAVNFYRQVAHYDPSHGSTVIAQVCAKYEHQTEWSKNVHMLLAINAGRAQT